MVAHDFAAAVAESERIKRDAIGEAQSAHRQFDDDLSNFISGDGLQRDRERDA